MSKEKCPQDGAGDFLEEGDYITNGKLVTRILAVDYDEGWLWYGNDAQDKNIQTHNFFIKPLNNWRKMNQQEVRYTLSDDFKDVLANPPTFKSGDIVRCIQRSGLKLTMLEIDKPYTIEEVEGDTVYLKGIPAQGFARSRFELFNKQLQSLGDW